MLMNVSTKRKNIHKQGNNFYPVIKKKSTVQKNKHTCKVITVMQSLKKKETVQKKQTHTYMQGNNLFAVTKIQTCRKNLTYHLHWSLIFAGLEVVRQLVLLQLKLQNSTTINSLLNTLTSYRKEMN